MHSILFSKTVSHMLLLTASAVAVSGCLTGGSENTESSPSADMGECHGVNSCKGQSACGGKGHSCAGKNADQAEGVHKMTKTDCDAMNGAVKAE